MGVVLTSRSARDMITRSPGEYAAYFDLTDAESAALAAMGADLAALMPGFVHKRERGLRQALRVTLSILGDQAATLIEDYTEVYGPPATTSADFLQFSDFAVAELRQRAPELPHGDLVVDIARYERMRLRGFHTEWPLQLADDATPLDPRQIDPERALWLSRGAAVEEFGWDVRTVRSAANLHRLRPDPAFLLCFQRPANGEVVVLRVDEECARAVDLIALRPGELTAPQVAALAGADQPPQVLLGKLVAQGVVRGTRS
jgi:hypothetical protein